ncbi:hypothetical protein QVD17_29304 [Tagetes erecta]|uniref:Uncharacterized protein n=1 Tax=Tagetes erecta TaxID=13708 RepID=A0AAD8NST6_TARER|nr:hypothetical protein QVD17_29304 [Tagetes erecta]
MDTWGFCSDQAPALIHTRSGRREKQTVVEFEQSDFVSTCIINLKDEHSYCCFLTSFLLVHLKQASYWIALSRSRFYLLWCAFKLKIRIQTSEMEALCAFVTPFWNGH